MAEIDDLKKQLSGEKAKVAALEKELAQYKKNAIARGYYVLNNIVNQQVDILAEFKLSTEISLNPKEDKKYDRVRDLWENMNKMLLNLDSLKKELRLTGDKDKDEGDVPFIESIAKQRT